MAKPNFRQNVAEEMLKLIEQGTAPWQKPWDPNKVRSTPFNPTSEKTYRGMNQFWLEMQGHEDPRWMTYKQAAAMGAQVTKGERATPIEYWKWTEQKPAFDDKGKPKLDEKGKQVYDTFKLNRPQTFRANVFNGSQIEGLAPFIQPALTFDTVERAEQLLKDTNVIIKHDQADRCFYRGGATDEIHMVPKEGFETAHDYYAIALHEVGHSTGHESRLNRDMGNIFGSEKYAVEELRAEMASYMLTTELGLGHNPERHAPYIKSWMKAIKDDKNILFQAARDAEKITEWVLEKDKRIEMAKGADMSKTAQEQEKTEGKSLWQKSMSAAKSLFVKDEAPEQATPDELPAPKEEKQQQNKGRYQRIYLDVPFKEKEAAKNAGAKWDKKKTSWYVNITAAPGYEKWLPKKENELATQPAPKLEEKSAQAFEKQQTPDRQYLNVSFKEKSEAKLAGAKWDRKAKSWYAPEGAEGLNKWHPDNTKVTTQMDPMEEFSQALKDYGLMADKIEMDGKWHRCQVEGDKKGEKNGSYRAFMDGVPNAQIKNFKDGAEAHKWVATGAKISEEERINLKRQSEIRRSERERERNEQHAKVSKIAYARIMNAPEAKPDHPYLEKKGIKPFGLKLDEKTNALLVPMQDTKGHIWSTQAITEKGDKRFMLNGRKEGLFHVLGDLDAKKGKQQTIIIAEGYGTGASVHEATKKPTVVAFDSGNLKPVAEAVRAKHPEAKIVIAADNDHSKKMNVGVTKAKEAALAVNGEVVIPKFSQSQKDKGFTDFNDLGQDKGLSVVAKALKPTKAKQQGMEV